MEQLYSREVYFQGMKAIVYVWYVAKTLGEVDSAVHRHMFLPLVMWFYSAEIPDEHNKGYGPFVGAYAHGNYYPKVMPPGRKNKLFFQKDTNHLWVAKSYIYGGISDAFKKTEGLWFPAPPFGDTTQFKAGHFAQWEHMDDVQRSALNNPENFLGIEFPLMDDMAGCTKHYGAAMYRLLRSAWPKHGFNKPMEVGFWD